MASREHELIQELRAARLREAEAKAAEAAARSGWLERKADTAEAARLVEEILQEVQNGSTGRPLIDYAESADERQRGPTAEPKRGTKRRPDVTDEAIAEANRQAAEMKAVVEPGQAREWAAMQLIVQWALFRDEYSAWDEFLDLGYIGDRDVIDALRSIWPAAPARHITPDGEYIIRGGAEPALWFPVTKHWASVVRPTLEGRALCEAVRHALDLPETEPVPAAKTKRGKR